MKNELVDDIYKQLINEDWKHLPPYLKGGKMGMGMFMALYSEYKNCRKARNVSAQILPEVLKSMHNLPNHILNGKAGIVWGIKYLSKKNILEEDHTIRSTYRNIWNEFLECCFMTPLYLPENESLFSIGIYSAQLFKQEDSLERYIVEERLLALIDECDRLLHNTIRGIYSPKDMSLSMLHSILYFLQKMNKEGIYSYLTQKLIESTDNIYSTIKSKEISDDYIYHILKEKEKTLPKNRKTNFYIDFLGNLGFYSLLYENPDIFNTTLNQLKEQNLSSFTETIQLIRKGNISIETLCGWGFGMLTNKKQENYEK